MALVKVIDMFTLEPITASQVKAGIHLFTIETFPSGAQVTYDGEVETVEVQANGWRVAHYKGLPRVYREAPLDLKVELYRVVD